MARSRQSLRIEPHPLHYTIVLIRSVHSRAQMCGMWSRAKGGAAHTGKALRLGCSLGRRREKDAVFEVRKEAMRFEGLSAEEAAGVFGLGKIAAPLANRRAYSLWRRRLLNGHGCFALRIFRAWPAIEVAIHIRHSAPDGSSRVICCAPCSRPLTALKETPRKALRPGTSSWWEKDGRLKVRRPPATWNSSTRPVRALQ
jgi:hypothetical protein